MAHTNIINLRLELIKWMEGQTNGFTNQEIKEVFGNRPYFKETYQKLKRRGSSQGFMIYIRPKWYVL